MGDLLSRKFGACRGLWGVILLSLCLAGAVQAETREADQAENGGFVAYQSIGQQGFKQGHRFDGAATLHEHEFYFPVPRDTRVQSARFRLVYRASALVSENASVSVEVNDEPLRATFISKRDTVQEMIVTLPGRALGKEGVQVKVTASLPVTDSRCLDVRLVGSFLHVLPETGLEIVHEGAGSLRDALVLLPETVELSLPEGPLSAAMYKSAWEVAERMQRSGHKVRFSRLPRIGHIVLGEREDIVSALAQRYPLDMENRWELAAAMLPAGSDRHFRVRGPNLDFIALTGPFEPGSLYPLSNTWSDLALTSEYTASALSFPVGLGYSPIFGTDTGAFALPLDSIGFSTGAKYVADQVEWRANVEATALLPRTRPERLNLKVLVPVRDDSQKYEMYVYLNDVLLQANRLEASGLYQEVVAVLPERYQRQNNDLRVLVKRDGPAGDCMGSDSGFPVQIAPESELIVTQDDSAPVQFADLPRFLSAGGEVFLAEDYLSSTDWLELLSSVTADFPFTVDFGRVTIAPAGAPVTPTGPFLAFGDVNLQGVEAPVHFDQGAVRVVDQKGNTLLDVSGLKRLAIAQVVHGADQVHGLWLRTAEQGRVPNLGDLRFNRDDIAFLDHTGVVLTINSDSPSLARVHYPEAKGWFHTVASYRFWFLALAWLLLTAVVIYIYRKSKEHDTAEVGEAGADVGKEQ